MALDKDMIEREDLEVKQNFEKRLCMLEAYAIQNRENISMMSASIFRMTGEIQPLFGTIREAEVDRKVDREKLTALATEFSALKYELHESAAEAKEDRRSQRDSLRSLRNGMFVGIVVAFLGFMGTQVFPFLNFIMIKQNQATEIKKENQVSTTKSKSTIINKKNKNGIEQQVDTVSKEKKE